MQSLSSLRKAELLDIAAGLGLDASASDTKAQIIEKIESEG